MKRMIDCLKENKVPFGYLHVDGQKYLTNVPPQFLERLRSSGKKECWLPGPSSIGLVFDFADIIRINKDYQPEPEPEPEIIECEVFSSSEYLWFNFGGQNLLSYCINMSNFYGLRWSDGDIMPADCDCYRRLINGKFEWPTHVLMKKSEDK